MLIGELSKRTGLSVHTLRFYEQRGLLKGEVAADVRTNNYKHYPESLVDKVALIKEAKEIGFTLAEISDLLDAWYSARLSIKKKSTVLKRKLDEIDDRIKQLKQVRKLLSQGLKDVEAGKC